MRKGLIEIGSGEWDEVVEEVHGYLLTYIKASGQTYGQIAKRAGISVPTLSNFIAEATKFPRANTVLSVARVIGVKFTLTYEGPRMLRRVA